MRFDVLTKTKQPERHRHWTQRDRAANVRLLQLAAETLYAIKAGVFVPNAGLAVPGSSGPDLCWAWR